MDLQGLTDLIKPQLMAPMSGLVLVLQIVRRNILRIEVKSKLPKNAMYGFMGANAVAASYLAWSYSVINPPFNVIDGWPVQAMFLFGWALATYHGLKFVFGDNGTK